MNDVEPTQDVQIEGEEETLEEEATAPSEETPVTE